MIPRLDIGMARQQAFAFWFGDEYQPKANEFLLNHSRNGICLALQSLRLPTLAKVGVMAYNCHTVFNAITQAGWTPVFVDVDETLHLDLEDLRKKSKELDAIIVTHLFGIINDVTAIRAICPNVCIIEDCAHAMGVSGKLGDFATFSIGQGKMPSIGDGGILIVNETAYLKTRPEVCHTLNKLYTDLPSCSKRREVTLFMRMQIKSWLYRPNIYSYLTMPLLKKSKKSGNVRCNEKIYKMASGIQAMYEQKRSAVPEEIRKHRMMAEKLCVVLRESENVHNIIVGKNAFMLVTYCDEPQILQQWLKNKGVDSATHFRNAIMWAKQFGYRQGDCPHAEQLTQHLLMIPTYCNYSL